MATKAKHKKTAAQIKYESMTRAERRVAIAKDVIAAIQAKKFGEVRCNTGYVVGYRGVLNEKTAREVMGRCTVCARGAMLLTRIAKYNGVVISPRRDMFGVPGPYGSESTVVGLKGAFSESQLDEIEAAFEGFTPVGSSTDSFYLDHPNDEDRLLAIMQNIVDHNGTFRPKVRYEIVYK